MPGLMMKKNVKKYEEMGGSVAKIQTDHSDKQNPDVIPTRRLCMKNFISEVVTPPSTKTSIWAFISVNRGIILQRLGYIQIENEHEDIMKPDVKTSSNPLLTPFHGKHF